MIRSPAFIAYLTLGDGGLEYSLQAALALVQGGVDVLEIGIPFSDPIADGPVIQEAMERALSCGTKPQDLLPFLRALRKHTEIPVVVFSYANPILAAGDKFLEEAKKLGANGLLLIDMPHELLPNNPLEPILVVSPSTSNERLKKIAEKGSGFIYYACQKGTTGVRNTLPQQIATDIARIKTVTSLPIALGFGIGSKEHAEQALKHADGFVVGSYFVEAMSRKVDPKELTLMAQQMDPRRKK